MKSHDMNSREFPLPFDTKQAIISTLFNCESLIEDGSPTSLSDSYFCYYKKLVENSREWSITNSHSAILDLVRLVKQPEATRSSIETDLRKLLLDEESEEADEIVEDSINLAVRLLLMVSTGGYFTIGRSLTVSGETKLSWKDGTIEDLVKAQFPKQKIMKESIKLEKMFNARNLEHIAGVKIRWTNNLADHLRMRDDDTAVEIFHHASFLRLHQISLVYSAAFVDEALRTLALLLPEHDESVERWFTRQEDNIIKRGKLPLDKSARECGQLKVEERQIDNFDYWHDRLVILKQVFDEAEPSNIRQWWNDRRKRVQWYTFWVAALVLGLTIFFGIIQSVEGALQVYLAYSPRGSSGT